VSWQIKFHIRASQTEDPKITMNGPDIVHVTQRSIMGCFLVFLL